MTIHTVVICVYGIVILSVQGAMGGYGSNCMLHINNRFYLKPKITLIIVF